MTDQYTSIPLANLVRLFIVLLIVGIGLTLPLFNFNLHRFIHSTLFTKIIFWIPIFLGFIFALYASAPLRLLLLLTLIVVAMRELVRAIKKQAGRYVYILYFIFFATGLLHFWPLASAEPASFNSLVITIVFATVLSDVTAFFFGNYLGRHKLPASLNNNKSWEGVFGEILGAFIGVALVSVFIGPVISLWLFLPIGLGSAFGDLFNSYIKRKADIKDWSNALPGHGGILDRFSSFAGSVLFTYYFLLLSNL